MWSSDSDREDAAAASPTTTATTTSSSCPSSPFDPPPTPPHPRRRRRHRARRRRAKTSVGGAGEEEHGEPAEAEDVWRGLQRAAAWPRRASRPVVVAGEEGLGGSLARTGSADGSGGGVVGRARSLTDDDLEELKGCVDLGFGFSYHEIPELCGTLPALELCYSMSQRFLDEHEKQQQGAKAEEAVPAAAPASLPQPVATNWKISSPGDSPDEVKARLKYWAQAVACTVKLCS